MNKKTLMIISLVLAIAINAFIIFQSCLPSGPSSTWSNAVVDVIEDISGGSVDGQATTPTGLTVSEFIRKSVGHFSLFGLSGLFTYLFFYFLYEYKGYKYYYLHVLFSLLTGIIVASLTEIIQLMVPGRCGDINDVLLDVGGFTIVLLLTLLITTIYKNIELKNKKNNCNPINK